MVQNGRKLHNYGWFGSYFENIQSDPTKEAKVDLGGNKTTMSKCDSHPVLANGCSSSPRSLFHWFDGSWPLASS